MWSSGSSRGDLKKSASSLVFAPSRVASIASSSFHFSLMDGFGSKYPNELASKLDQTEQGSFLKITLIKLVIITMHSIVICTMNNVSGFPLP